MNASVNFLRNRAADILRDEQLVTFVVEGQMFGIPAMKVRDVLRRQPLTRVPLAPKEVAGAINLRGHIVTAINVRARLDMLPAEPDAASMCVVIERKSEAFCLLVDSVGDVITVNADEVEPNPESLHPSWSQISRGVCRLNSRLMLLLDIDLLLTW